MSGRAYSVYVLWSDVGKQFYIGVTEELPNRLQQHNSGVSKWTKRYAGSWRVVWSQPAAGLGDARRLENKLKKQKGGSGFWLLTGLDRGDFR